LLPMMRVDITNRVGFRQQRRQYVFSSMTFLTAIDAFAGHPLGGGIGQASLADRDSSGGCLDRFCPATARRGLRSVVRTGRGVDYC
jgi:hypothetical protein